MGWVSDLMRRHASSKQTAPPVKQKPMTIRFSMAHFLRLSAVGFGEGGTVTLTGKEKTTDENHADSGNTKRKFDQFCIFHGSGYLEREFETLLARRATTMPPIMMMAAKANPPRACIIDAFSIFDSKICIFHDLY